MGFSMSVGHEEQQSGHAQNDKRAREKGTRFAPFLHTGESVLSSQFSLVDPCDLNTYSAAIKAAAQNGSHSVLDNLRPWHAATVIRQIASFASKKQLQTKKSLRVDIVTGSCDDYFYGGPTADSLATFVSRNGTLNVLIFSPRHNKESCELYQRLLIDGALPPRVRFDVVEAQTPEGIPHFMVACGEACRLESEECNGTSGSFTDLEPIVSAKVCFNSPSVANKLHALYDTLAGIFLNGKSTNTR